nr:DEAD/DEAH box helicase family protein [Roseomonas rubea]
MILGLQDPSRAPLILRGYQAAALSDLLRDLHDRPTGAPVVVLPTGAGKSLVIAALAANWIASRPASRIAVIAPTQELVEQDEQELRALWPNADLGVVCSGLRRKEFGQTITVTTAGSARGNLHRLGIIDLVVIDEAHRVPTKANAEYQRVLAGLREANPALRVVGMTATPYRLDQGLLTEGKDRLFDRIAHEIEVADLIRQGFLAKPVSRIARPEIDTSEVRTRAGEFVAGELEAAAMKAGASEPIADAIAAAAEGEPRRKSVMVFCCGVAHAQMMADLLTARGIEAEALIGDMPGSERARIVAAFKDGSLRCITSVIMATTGFNAAAVDLVALARPTQSRSLYVQMVGRGLRLAEGKTDCLIADHAGNLRRFGPVDRATPATGPAGKVCAACGADNDRVAPACSHCGHAFPAPPRPVPAAAPAIVPLRPLPAPVAAPRLPAVPAGGGVIWMDPHAAGRPGTWVRVVGVEYSRHFNQTRGTESLRASYTVAGGPARWVNDFRSIVGYMRVHTEQWWARRCGEALPDSVADALVIAETDGFKAPCRLLVDFSGKWPNVIGEEFAPGPAAALPMPAPQPKNWRDAVALAANFRPLLHAYLRHDVHLIHFGDRRIVIRTKPTAPPDIVQQLAECLLARSGIPWVIETADDLGEPTLAEQEGKA